MDGKRIFAAGGGRIPGCDSSIRVFDRNSGKEILLCRGHVCGIYQISLHPGTGFLASASEDYSVVLWNFDQQDALFLVGGDPIVKGCVTFTREGNWLAVGETEAYEDFHNSAFVIDLDSGQEVFRQRLKKWKEVAGLAISPGGGRLFVAVANLQHNPTGIQLYCWKLPHGRSVWTRSIRNVDITELHLLPGEDRLAAAIMEAKHPEYLSGVCLLEARSGKVVAKQLFEGIGSCVAVSPDGRILAVAGDFS